MDQSKIAEDQFHRGRRREKSQVNALMAEKSLWKALVDTKVSSELFRYKEVEWELRVVHAGTGAAMGRDLFQVKVTGIPEQLKDVVTTSSKPKWCSTDPEGLRNLYTDLHLMTAAASGGSWADIVNRSGWAQ